MVEEAMPAGLNSIDTLFVLEVKVSCHRIWEHDATLGGGINGRHCLRHTRAEPVQDPALHVWAFVVPDTAKNPDKHVCVHDAPDAARMHVPVPVAFGLTMSTGHTRL